ncbi:membrane protein [Amycolatopsis sp. NBRC 101858]|uniref:NfeD family protein n=1 Tax=Amycolatopsis sp. NBRC 101858 TaxID=3032200 RepID=UPI0024A27BB9|nr:NfeD family protein [Amycolatopsis sp. NBRC 101858]GLY38063.1 membrane protein [Amycolatopsis sp. NBRC 101858]
MDEGLIWLAVAIVLAVVEVFSATIALGVLALAALVTAGTAALGLALPGQLLVFAIASAAGVVLARPVAQRYRRRPESALFGVDALVGRQAHVVEEVTGVDGRIRIGGEEWTARTFDDALVIRAGTVVDVLAIEGSTAFVHPREETWTSRPQ